ncbi:MAG: M3 family oligoendopeptidase [Clostridia bacterium]|nr:M3 family oligoendopeptidase [Clostridia bacterium]MBR3680464.1 M3 family oligoendopeptidase [Clostridia bacterium]
MGTWDLTILYDGFDTAEYKNGMARLEELIGEYTDLASTLSALSPAELVLKYVRLSESLSDLVGRLAIYANLRMSANTRDSEAASMLGRIMSLTSATAAPTAVIEKAISEIEDLEGVIDSTPELSEFKYLVMNIKRDSKYLLSDKEESILSRLDISGASAWSDLHSNLTSGVAVDYEGEKITLSSVRNLAYSPDADVRKKAYGAELACYDKIKDAVALALNSIKLQVLTECELRGYESPLDKSLYQSRMKRETLDALLTAMREYLPVFHKYLRAKAKALGHEGALPWYDLFAPMGKSDTEYTVDGAKEYLLGIFSEFDTELYGMVKTAFENRWIDFFPREGKVGGAFDCGVPSAKQSRVLTNFDGSFSDVVTLAHELGHAFHDKQVFAHSVINQSYSMPVAETASTFNEVLVMETAIARATDKEEKIALIESQLMDACQIICDIYSRFLFEASVFENRPTEVLSPDRMCELMLTAQRAAYGDGLDADCLHPYMWLCKGHYYSGGLSFYNYPYAFGGLFARGLYAKYKAEGAAFVDTYKAMLRATSVTDVEECALIAGVDLTDPEFWRSGLRSISDRIDEFCDLVG